MKISKESFDNYYNDVNSEFFNYYPEELESYLRKEWSDKWMFHKRMCDFDNYPLTLLGTIENLKESRLEKLSKKGCYWYIKKRDGSYGRSICITKNPLSFFGGKLLASKVNSYLIQKEIKSELHNGRKYDYRIYIMLLRRGEKIEYYYYKRYVVRFCYKGLDEKRDIYNSITNHHIYSLLKLDENFYELSDKFDKDNEKIESLNESFINRLREYEYEYKDMMCINSFRILGLDYMVESKTDKIYILELNTIPGVYYGGVEDEFFKRYNNFHMEIIKDLDKLFRGEKNDWKVCL